MIDIQPLDVSKYDLIDQQATKAEWVWQRVPIVGMMISTVLWERRNRPLFDEYQKVLESRPLIPSEVWGDAQRQEIGLVIGQAAQAEIGWPNNHFIPNDPIRVSLWSFHDALDATEAIAKIGEQYGVQIKWDDLIPIWNSNLTDLVDLILSLPKES